MKKIVLAILVMAAVSYAYALPPVNEQTLKNFGAAFPGVENAKWYEHENFTEAYFDNGDVKCRVRFDTEGKLLSTIRYYTGKTMAPFLKAKLAAKYPGKKIFGVTEVTNDDELTYNVILEDDKTWTEVKSDGTGQMEVVKSFKKATP